jgi:hypothetical protein
MKILQPTLVYQLTNIQMDPFFFLSKDSRIESLIFFGLNDGTAKFTPAIAPLGKCKDDHPATGAFNYRPTIGMMMYLGNNTRGDSTFANQCAQFSSNRRIPHEQAVKSIECYLLGTRDEGLLIQPNGLLALDTYVDADFTGLEITRTSKTKVASDHAPASSSPSERALSAGRASYKPRSQPQQCNLSISPYLSQ